MMLTNKTWNVSDVGSLGQSDTLIDVLLKNRGITDEAEVRDFITENPTLWHDPFLYKDMDKAVELISSAIAGKERILVYGDYDCDGVTATAIIVRYLRAHGATVDYIVPHRAEHGYGLTDNIIDKVFDFKPDLLITVDCGITNFDTISMMKEKGIKVIVTDHHNVKDGLIPDADCVICAKRPDNTYPFIDLCGAGVALKLVEAMGKKSDYKLNRDMWRQSVEMAGIATIADLVSVVNENRTIIKKALESMNTSSPANPGVRVMNSLLADEGRPVDETYISFNFVPRVNAAGRLYDSSEALKLFLEDDENTAREAANELTRENDERKAIESSVFDEAVKQIEDPNRPEEWSLTNTIGPIVVYGRNWHQGVLGIVAGKLSQYFRRSAIVFTNDSIETDCVKGSGRAYGDFDLFSVLNDVSDSIVNFGGHKKAAGVVVRKDKMGEFMRSLEARSRELAGGMGGVLYEPEDVLDVDCELPFEMVTFDTFRTVCRLKPFGISNSKPVFVTRGLIISDLYTMSDGAHLRVDLISSEADGSGKQQALSAVGFGMGQFASCFTVGDKVDVAYTLNEYTYRGNTTLSLHLEDIKPVVKGFLWEQFDTAEKLYRSGLAIDQISKMNKSAEKDSLVPVEKDFANVYSTIKDSCGNKNSTVDCVLLAKMVNISCRARVTPFSVKRCLEVFSEAGLIKLGTGDGGRVCFTVLPVQGKAKLSNTVTYKRLTGNG